MQSKIASARHAHAGNAQLRVGTFQNESKPRDRTLQLVVHALIQPTDLGQTELAREIATDEGVLFAR